MENRVIFGLFLFVLLFIHSVAFGDATFRCKGNIISIGDYQSTVLDKCGEPDHMDTWEETVEEFVSKNRNYGTDGLRVGKRIEKIIKYERWTYNLGSGKFIRYLLFKNNVLDKINTGDKGSN
ncbi:MAG: DUF2845 domain-containing protein [Desulfobacteraceae bacterium]|jgi:hypothetical protein